MPLIVPNIPSTVAGRRWFGLAVAGSLGLLAVLSYSWFAALAACLLALAAVWSIVYFGWPHTQPTLIRSWHRVTWPISWFIGHTLLLGVYFGVLWPIAIFRRCSPTAMRLKFVRGRSTWQDKTPVRDDSYFQQF